MKQNEINLHIGMKKVQTGAADYKIELRRFLEKDELFNLEDALEDEDKELSLHIVQALKIKTMNLGLMHLYELFVEMGEILTIGDIDSAKDLLEEVARSKNKILASIA